jgi:hypothetical protein
MSKNVLPISALPGELSAESPIAWNVGAGSYVNADKITMDVGHARLTMRALGLGGLVVTGYIGEQDVVQTSSVGIGSVNLDGTATAVGGVSRAQTRVGKYSLDRDRSKDTLYDWPVASIEINRTKLASRIADHVQQGQSHEQAWGAALDSALRSEMWRAGKDNLVGSSLHSVMSGGLGMGIFAHAIVADKPPIGWGLLYALSLLVPSFGNKRRTGSVQLGERRWSLSPTDFQPDRLAVGGILLASKPLVRGLR